MAQRNGKRQPLGKAGYRASELTTLATRKLGECVQGIQEALLMFIQCDQLFSDRVAEIIPAFIEGYDKDRDRLLSLNEAADLLGISRDQIRQALRCGDLDGIKTGTVKRSQWRIKQRDLIAWHGAPSIRGVVRQD